MIELRSISKTFHVGKPTEVTALKSVNLLIQPGEFIVLVGENGSGKSTLLNTIAGSIRQDNGQIFINGVNVSQLAAYQRSKWVARVFQNPLSGTAPGLSVLANFRLATLRREMKKMKLGISSQFREEVIAKIKVLDMGLERKLDVPMGSLSGGQRQALTLLMAVMTKPDLLLLDEPTAALDPHSARTLMRMADQLISEHSLTAMLVTHNLSEATHYGSRLIQMQEGTIVRDVGQEPKKSLKQEEILNWFDYL